MLKVKHKIESKTVKEARSKAKRDSLYHMFLIIGILTYNCLIVNFDVIYFFGDKDFYKNYIDILSSIVVSIKGSFDIFMHILFITIFIYFLRLKNARQANLSLED